MSLVKRTIGKRRYWYLKLPGPREIYLGPEDDLKLRRLREAIEYVRPRVEHYSEILQELEGSLPEEERRRLQEALPKEIIGSKTPFWQEGSLRIVLPNRFVERYSSLKPRKTIGERTTRDETPIVFLETDKGILMRPLSDVLNDQEMKRLTFAPISGLSLKEISKLIDEEADKKQ